MKTVNINEENKKVDYKIDTISKSIDRYHLLCKIINELSGNKFGGTVGLQ